MPIFTKKFAPKCAPPRTGRLNIGCPKIDENLVDFKEIKLDLNGKELKFIDGVWLQNNKTNNQVNGSNNMNSNNLDDVVKLRKKLQSLEQENNLYQIKYDIFLDLLTENMSELNALKN